MSLVPDLIAISRLRRRNGRIRLKCCLIHGTPGSNPWAARRRGVHHLEIVVYAVERIVVILATLPVDRNKLSTGKGPLALRPALVTGAWHEHD